MLTDAEIAALIAVLANETTPGANTKTRVAEILSALNDNKLSGADLEQLESYVFAERSTATAIAFNRASLYGSALAPIAAETITFDFADAQIGVVQRMIHESNAIPMLPATAKKLSGDYVVNQVNIFYFDYEDNNNVYYTISQVL